MYELTRTAKLPISAIRGSGRQREILSDQYFKDFCRRISVKLNSDSISTDEIKNAFIQTIPHKIGIQFRNIGKKYWDSNYAYEGTTTSMIRGKNKKVSGYVVMLPLDDSNKCLKLENLNILLHEMKHIYNYITNPKMLNAGLYTPQKLIDFYDEKIYPRNEIKLEKLAERTTNAIKRRPYYTQVDFLQYCRYELKNEISAFNAEKYYNELQKEHPETIKRKRFFNDIEFFQMREKLSIIKNLLKKELSKLREENKSLYSK